MYFVVSAGGTAGHINPALAVADELRSCGHEILFVGTPDHIEAKLAREAGFDFVGLSVSGFDKSHPWSLAVAIKRILSATKQAKEMFRRRRPDAVLGFGAYVSVPVGRAAHAMGIPLVIHEQNSVPGMANTYLARRADITAVAYAAAAGSLSAKTAPIVVGNPVRPSIDACDGEAGRELFGIPKDTTLLLIFGGSLGAAHLNRAMAAIKHDLLAIEGLYIVHSTGASDFEAASAELALTEDEQQRWHLVAYIDRMGDVLAGADMAVSRAGASSLAEIVTLGVPSVLVPYPYARGDHQTLNAADVVKAGAAVLVADDAIDDDAFRDLVIGLVQDTEKRAVMRKASQALSGADARRRLAQLAVQLATERK